MLDIKDEIKDAQKLFEVKSDIISNIMDNIFNFKLPRKVCRSKQIRAIFK